MIFSNLKLKAITGAANFPLWIESHKINKLCRELANTPDFIYVDQDRQWLMFFSKAAYHREVKILDKKIKLECDNQNKAWWHLSNQIFKQKRKKSC